jgi:GDP-L-fucose synthase
MNKDSRIYIAGHRGLVGSTLMRTLKEKGYTNLVGRTHSELDLTDRSKVDDFFSECQPEYVFDSAAKVGGIHANNTYAGEFIYQNLQIQNNIIDACHKFDVKKLCFLGSVCIYPKFAPVPVKEEYLLTGELEESNQWYAIAKIAGIKMCQAYNKQYGTNFISVMPANLYGKNDNFHPLNSHVIPALIRKFHEAKQDNLPHVTCWGSGMTRREFLYVDDLISSLEFLMLNYDSSEIINVGSNIDYSIKEIAERVAHLIGYEGEIKWDTTKPDGTPKRMMDSSKLFDMGWSPTVNLEEGLTKTIIWYRNRRE